MLPSSDVLGRNEFRHGSMTRLVVEKKRVEIHAQRIQVLLIQVNAIANALSVDDSSETQSCTFRVILAIFS